MAARQTRQTRRGPKALAKAIRAAVWEELQHKGYAGVTFEGVARRVRTSKTVLYRRYRSRAHMVFDVVASLPGPLAPDPSLGSLRADLIAFMLAAHARFMTFGPTTLHGVFAEADGEFRDELVRSRERLGAEIDAKILAPARARGEIGPGPISLRVATLPVVMLHHEVLLKTVDEDAIREMVDDAYLPLLRAVAGGGRDGVPRVVERRDGGPGASVRRSGA